MLKRYLSYLIQLILLKKFTVGNTLLDTKDVGSTLLDTKDFTLMLSF